MTLGLRVWAFMLVLVSATGGWAAAGAAEPPRVANAAGLADRLAELVRRVPPLPPVRAAAGVLRWADGQLWQGTGGPVFASSAPRIEGTSLVVTVRVPAAEVRQEFFDVVPVEGSRIPGRWIGHAVRADCLVHAWLPAGGPVCTWDPARPRDLTVALPIDHLSAEFPPGEEVRFETEYGDLKPRLFYAGDAAEQRKGLHPVLMDLAKGRVRDELAGGGGGLADELAAAVRPHFPACGAAVRAGPGGIAVTLADFFPAASEEGGGPAGSVSAAAVVLAAAAAGVVALAAWAVYMARTCGRAA